jgi:hypothetical protein
MEGCRDARNGVGQRCRIEEIAFHGLHAGRRMFARPDQDPAVLSGLNKTRHQALTDQSGCTSNQDRHAVLPFNR